MCLKHVPARCSVHGLKIHKSLFLWLIRLRVAGGMYRVVDGQFFTGVDFCGC